MGYVKDTIVSKKTVEVFLDSSAYYKGDTLELIEELRQLFIISGLPEIRFIATSQSVREQANSGSLSLMTSARFATASLQDYTSVKPDTHFSRHAVNTGFAYDYYITPACREYQNTLIHEIFPTTLCEPIGLIEKYKDTELDKSLTDICKREAKKLKRLTSGILPDSPDDAFSRTLRKQIGSVYSLAYMMQSQHGKNGLHELEHTHWDRQEDVRIVNPKTKKIDDPFIIQALAMHPYFWKPVSEKLKDHPAKLNSADRSILYYFVQTLPQKPDVKSRMFFAITDDIVLRDSFAAYTSGNIRGNLHLLQDYKRPFLANSSADHYVASTLTLPGIVEHDLLSLVPAALTDPIDGNPVVENLISSIRKKCQRIKEYGVKRCIDSPKFKELATDYEDILSKYARQAGAAK